MKIFTTHFRPGTPPALVREGFSWGAFFFGFLYLAAFRAWIPAALNLAAVIVLSVLCRYLFTAAPLLGLAVLQGVFGRDLRRWGLERRGYAAGPVVAARTTDEAFARLVTERRDLLPLLDGAAA